MALDKYFSNLAEKDGRKQLYLETLEQQLKFLTSFKDIDPDELIMSTLKELQDISSVMKKALVAWQQGDMSL